MNRSDELLYDSVASLRLIDQAIGDLGHSVRDSQEWIVLRNTATPAGGFAGVDGLRQLDSRIRDVSAATEAAATDIFESVTRAVALVERLGAAGAAERPRVLEALDGELAAVTSRLQFQDVTTQQLGQIASILADMRLGLTPRSLPAISASAPEAQAAADRLLDRAGNRRSA